jgi:hypothetical protein
MPRSWRAAAREVIPEVFDRFDNFAVVCEQKNPEAGGDEKGCQMAVDGFHVLSLPRVEHLEHTGQVMVVVFSGKIQMIDQAHWGLQAWVRDYVCEQRGIQLAGS